VLLNNVFLFFFFFLFDIFCLNLILASNCCAPVACSNAWIEEQRTWTRDYGVST
jgi:hypothetical protein